MRIVNVMAVSLDGRISFDPNDGDGIRRNSGFTSQEDHDFVKSEIASADAIVTGAQSVRGPGRLWSQRGVNGQFPHWFVFTRKGLEPELEFWKQKEIPRTLVSPNRLDPRLPDETVSRFEVPEKNPAGFLRDF